MAISTRNRRALIALVVLCSFAFLSLEILITGYKSIWEIRSDSRGRTERVVRNRRAMPLSIPELPKITLNEDAVRLELKFEKRLPREIDSNIRISEIFYHPGEESEDREFIELANFTEKVISLSGWRFTKGIEFTFPDGVVLEQGKCVVLCKNESAFRSSFGDDLETVGNFQGGLKNSGELLRLKDENGKTILEQSFADSPPWPQAADGKGASLQIKKRDFNPNDPGSWIAKEPTPGNIEPLENSDRSFGVLQVRHEPRTPTPRQSVEISALIAHSDPQFSLEMHLEIDGAEYRFPRHSEATDYPDVQDGSDALTSRFSARLPPLAHFTFVRYWFTGKDATGTEYRFPSLESSSPDRAYFVRDDDSADSLPVYSLRLNGADLEALQFNSRNNQTYPATLVVKGRIYDRIRIRCRGAFARSWPKKSYKLFFNKGNQFQGQSRINLNSSWRDPGFVREVLSYRIYKEAGAYSLASQPVRLEINGEFWGLFTSVQQPDKQYLESQGLKGAVLYKADSRNNVSDERFLGNVDVFRRHYEKETAEEEGFEDLANFCRGLEEAIDVKEFFEANVDLPRYINFLCATTLCQNWDAYNKNHFIGMDRDNTGKWFVLPWDLDRTLGDHWHGYFDEARLPALLGTRDMPGVTGWNRMAGQFFGNPDLRRLYVTRMRELLDEVFSEAKLYPLIDSFRREISDTADLDRVKWRGAWGSQGGLNAVKEFVRRRREFLKGELGGL